MVRTRAILVTNGYGHSYEHFSCNVNDGDISNSNTAPSIGVQERRLLNLKEAQADQARSPRRAEANGPAYRVSFIGVCSYEIFPLAVRLPPIRCGREEAADSVGQNVQHEPPYASVCFRAAPAPPVATAMVKVFGCRQASENRPSTNPRGCGDGLWGFRVLRGWGSCAAGSVWPLAGARCVRFVVQRMMDCEPAAPERQ